jgi:diaminohydroxyphosphoribosylaminopyrimidine deaminase / 5-amino-6-(5-phosphoribosylamino)uracil reductase
MTTNEKYMDRCIELALKGAGNVSPNPMVGCVIVKNGKIVAEGYHKKYGEYHAERNAINSALKKGINLKRAELYVNLEPCAHQGKTPPCADYIIQHKFKRVIIGIKDPYHLVAGKGIRKLKQAGIEVKTGVLEDKCREVNKFFFKFVETGLPYVTIKTAQTLDGKIANTKFHSKWISSPESRRLVHKMRAVYDAVLVGRNTVKYDDPELTVRDVKGRDPFRIAIDPLLDLSLHRKMFSAVKQKGNTIDNKTIIFTSNKASKAKINLLTKRGILVVTCAENKNIINVKEVLKKIASLGIASVMVEGGALTYNEFIKNKLVDEFMIFIAPKIMGNGINAFKDEINFSAYKNISYYKVSTDILLNISKH